MPCSVARGMLGSSEASKNSSRWSTHACGSSLRPTQNGRAFVPMLQFLKSLSVGNRLPGGPATDGQEDEGQGGRKEGRRGGGFGPELRGQVLG